MDPRKEYIELMQEQLRQHEDALAKLRREGPHDLASRKLEPMLRDARRRFDAVLASGDDEFGALRLEFDAVMAKLADAFRQRGANAADVAVKTQEETERAQRAERGT